MTDNAVVLLDAHLQERSSAREAPLPADQEFELFAFDQALKEEDLSPDEIAAGQVGGGNDGGLDGVFTFLNGNLLEEDSELLEDGFEPNAVKRESRLELIVIQAKQTASFAETPFEKVSASLRELLDLAKSDEDLEEIFSSTMVDRLGIFRQAWQKIATRHPRISITFVYATKGDISSINSKVNARSDLLMEQIETDIPKSVASIRFLGARELIDIAGREKSYTLQLGFSENATADSSHLALVSLNDYYEFMTDDQGSLRKYIFDWNVRDYEGKVEVNKEIRESLADPNAPEFWWLNNGITIICSAATSTGRIFSLDDVQIVNGLQTSMTIHEYLKAADSQDVARARSILVRIVVTEDHVIRDRVIRATNRQTAVPAASLRATDQIQRDLERFFLQHEWFYERRKNYYRNQAKSASRIVSIPYLAQAIMAIGLSEPSNSRARPSSLLKRDVDYERIFDSTIDYDVYLWVAVVQRKVDDFLRSEKSVITTAERTNLRFHVSMLVVAKALGARVYNPSQLSPLVGTEFGDENIEGAVADIQSALKQFQGDDPQPLDKIAKGRDFTEALMASHFP